MTKTQKSQKQAFRSCIAVIAVFTAILIIPPTREIFKSLSGGHPFVMGFIKFALLATSGELLAIRLSTKSWSFPDNLIGRALVWGLIGAVLALMLKIYSLGIAGVMEAGVIPGKGSVFVTALITSAVMNATFGPVMMGFHKMTDKYFELRSAKTMGISFAKVAESVDWKKFITFVVLKTIPLFWIPAHTITFMLPAEYQTVMAAFLSIALGIILSFGRK